MTTSGGFSPERLERLNRVLAGYVERGALPGLVALVSRHGEVHVEVHGTLAVDGEVPMRRDTIFRIASMTKPITAVAAMILVEECKLRLDEPVDRLLPELADRRVLRRLDGPLDDTVPARRSITLRDLLTFRLGYGIVMAPPGQYPIQRAMDQLGLSPGAIPPNLSPDEWLRRLGNLPLVHQPGEGWLYHTGADVLGILIARAADQPFESFLRERIFEPLGMKDTSFHVPPDRLNRLPPSYAYGLAADPPAIHDDPAAGYWSRSPTFPSGGGGLVSTVDDYHAFGRMLLNQGRAGNERILSRPAVELMTTDQLTPEERAGARVFFGDSRGWGFGVSVFIRRVDLASTPGRFGWEGGIGTSGYTDPAEDLIGILMTQRLMASPEPPPHFEDFWTSVYQAIDD